MFGGTVYRQPNTQRRTKSGSRGTANDETTICIADTVEKRKSYKMADLEVGGNNGGDGHVSFSPQDVRRRGMAAENRYLSIRHKITFSERNFDINTLPEDQQRLCTANLRENSVKSMP